MKPFLVHARNQWWNTWLMIEREREVVLTVTIDSVEFLRIYLKWSKSGTVKVEQLVCLHVIKNDHKLHTEKKKTISILFSLLLGRVMWSLSAPKQAKDISGYTLPYSSQIQVFHQMRVDSIQPVPPNSLNYFIFFLLFLKDNIYHHNIS